MSLLEKKKPYLLLLLRNLFLSTEHKEKTDDQEKSVNPKDEASTSSQSMKLKCDTHCHRLLLPVQLGWKKLLDALLGENIL